MLDIQSVVYVAYQVDTKKESAMNSIEASPRKLAPPFDAIFADRAQAERAFDLFADAVERLGGGLDDPRFALTLPRSNIMRLNIGNSIVMDFRNHGQTFHLTALTDEMEGVFNYPRSEIFRVTVKGTSKQFAVYTIPPEAIRQWPSGLQAIMERSMEAFGKEFIQWQKSNLRRAHREEVFAALFDKEKRERLLAQGLTAADFAAIEELMNDKPPTPSPDLSIANEFKGFTADAFAFLGELAANNNKAWMDANRERWKNSVREPMRALFADLGPHVKKLFDPYLLPDELEIERKILANINKNWTATPDSKYHEYYWGAFYRRDLSRQTDAQLFVNIFPDMLRGGFYMGHGTDNTFGRSLREHPDKFLALVGRLELEIDFVFERALPDGSREAVPVQSADDLIEWTATNNFGFVRRFTPAQVVAQGPALADTILDTFRRVFPIYLLAVADEPDALIERYLETEFGTDEDDDLDEPAPTPYIFADFTRHTCLTDGRAAELQAMLMDKRQAIFYGPPGTGKTFVARHLGRLLTGLADPPPERLTVVQFHPAYGYEEFIEGIRPRSKTGEDGRAVIDYPVRPGAFVRFCREAAQYGDQPCVFIIDEINRGNIPRIFGELMLLLEYRDQSIPLPYSGDRFRIPPNVYVIGTMNTADRSIALVDFALRRRFHFARFAANPELFDRWLAGRPAPPWLGALYRRLTEEAIDDEDYRIGPSVFMRDDLSEEGARRAWEWSVLPWLREYYIDQPARAELWAWDGELLHGIRGNNGG